MVDAILRERVYVDRSLTAKEIAKQYGLCKGTANRARKIGYFCKNYTIPQVCINAENYNPQLILGMARKLFWKKFWNDPLAQTIRDDLIQEGCMNAWIKSGYYKANEKYNLNYHMICAISNGMTAFYTAYLKNVKYRQIAVDYVKQRAHWRNGKMICA